MYMARKKLKVLLFIKCSEHFIFLLLLSYMELILLTDHRSSFFFIFFLNTVFKKNSGPTK